MKSVTTKAIMDYLKSEGIQGKQDKDGNINFRYQFCNFLITIDENDGQFLRILMPGIFEIDDDNFEDAMDAANQVNSMIKVVKAVVTDDYVNLSAEILLDSTPVYADVFPRMLDILMGGKQSFYDTIEEECEEECEEE